MNKMKNQLLKINYLFVAVFFFVACGGNKTQCLTSPDGNTVVSFTLSNGNALYSVRKDGKEFIKDSRLGFLFSNGDSLCAAFNIIRTTSASFDEIWEQPWGEEITVRNHYNEIKIELQETAGEKRLLNIIFRAFDDGIGFRYEFPEQENLKTFEIAGELTEFALPEDYQAWSIPAYKGEYYESLYKKSPISELDTVCSPLTIETTDGGYIAIHEANLTDYAAMNLYPENGSTVLKTDLTPWSTGIKVYAQTPFVSPWRTIILANDLNELVNSRIMLNLNEPCKIEDTSWIHPAKYTGIWWAIHQEKYTWSQGPKHGATTKNVKEYIDFAATHHLQGVLAEGWNQGWDGDWVSNGFDFSFTKPYPDFDTEELSRYASSKGIALIGHHETGGSTLNYEDQMEEAFAYCNKWGINSVKTGYVNRFLDKKERHSSQYGVRHYRKVIETAAKYHIMIDNHEPVMPTGLQRTYPNLMSQEGVRGQEYDAWSRDGGNPPEHTTIVPFTRGLAGPMDFTFGTFNFDNPVYPQTRVQTTIAKQLALYVVIYSPLQMVSDLPENYVNNPAFEFIEVVPVDWEKTIIQEGIIGDYVVTARKDKHSDDWFLGAITDENARNLKINFSFLDESKTYKAKIFRDASDSNWKTNPYPVVIEEIEADAHTILDLYLATGGGAAIWIKNID
ncbi:MAG: glycoside hydrolase family 97 protein [Dysgonamonadaceae bacterium]|jgi:alpha-glucosidase|nr:glycoside hydrolase family 97 protein [Dysgonamonadaceae bacterium]